MWEKAGGGAHEIGTAKSVHEICTANFVLEGAPLACGKKQGAARTKLAQRISYADVLLACVKRGELRGDAHSMWQRGEACTKLVQRISCLGVVLARSRGAHELDTANFV